MKIYLKGDKVMEFSKLYEIAKATLNTHELSRSSYTGSVAAAILTERGNVYIVYGEI